VGSPDKEKYPERYEAYCRKISKRAKRRWRNPIERAKWEQGIRIGHRDPKVRKKKSELKTLDWADSEKRKRMKEGMKKGQGTIEARKKNSAARKKEWENPEARKKKSEAIKKYNYKGGHKARERKWRKKCILYGGRYCRKCKLDLLLEGRACFHHIYLRDNESFGILEACGCNNRSWNEYKEEIKKCLLLCPSCHSKIEWWSYDYLVETNCYKKYIKWFLRVYKPQLFDVYRKGVHRHHKDLNIKNNNKENFLFLKIGEHLKLHRYSYKYLIEINEIDNYIEWFLNQREKFKNENKNVRNRSNA